MADREQPSKKPGNVRTGRQAASGTQERRKRHHPATVNRNGYSDGNDNNSSNCGNGYGRKGPAKAGTPNAG